jgi:hypothetical protein
LEDAAADLEDGRQSVYHPVWGTLYQRDQLTKPRPRHTNGMDASLL